MIIKPGVFQTWSVMTKYADAHVVHEVIDWCMDNIEPNDGTLYHCRKYTWTYERFPHGTNFVFDRETDALMFALRWA